MFKRKERHAALVNITAHGVQLARLSHLQENPVVADELQEVSGHDEAAVSRWLEKNFPKRGSGFFTPGYCSFFPEERVLLREAIATRRLIEPWYLPSLLEEQGKIASAKDWQVGALHTVDGLPLDPESPQRAGLLVGLPTHAIREVQQKLLRWGVRPRRLEMGTITLLGGLMRFAQQQSATQAIAAAEIGRAQTRLYFLGKDGVHTPPPLPHGLASIEDAAMKILNVTDRDAARLRLETPSDDLRAQAPRLVRMLSRHLRPAVDYFEMQTGQRAGSLFCAHLPAKLGWLETALGAEVDLEFLAPPLAVKVDNSLAPSEPESMANRTWFQAFTLVSPLSPILAMTATPA